MVWPDSSEPRRVLDEPHPSDATQTRQRIISQPLLQDSRISVGPSDASAGPQIERILEQVLEQVLLATSATAAAIALKTDGQMVCRAAAGPNAPDVGVRLDVSSGLSGACVRTQETQYCADTQNDPRANAVASRRLRVRSVLVVPLTEGNELLGVFEIFSPHPGAFGNRDLQNLQILAQVIMENLRDPGEHPALPAAAAEFSPVAPLAVPEPQAKPTPPSSLAVTETLAPDPDEPLFALATSQPLKEEKLGQAVAPAVGVSVPAGWGPPQAEPPVFPASFPARVAREKRSREWGTSVLTAAVITVAVVLGWTVGRPSWQRVTGAERKQAGTAAPVSGSPESSEGRSTPPAAKSADSDTVEPADDSVKAGGARTSKSNPDEASGGLVVYQNGKVIFRQTPRAWPGGRASAELKAPQPDPEATEKVAAVFLSPQMASGRLIQRIEPVYPEPALEQRIQGEVELEALVGKDGFVEQLKLVSGDAQLAAAAADAVRRWRFRPYQSDGQAVEFSTHVSVDFRLP